jgi:hypothetical protein
MANMIIIGDSHTWMFKNLCATYHISNPTAHNIHKHDKIIRERLRKDELNAFIFGDIDCRIHFYHQCKKQKRSLFQLIQETVDRYIDYVRKIICENYVIIIIGVPPAGVQENRFGYQHYASYKLRKKIYIHFNTVLKKECTYHNILFIDYFNDVTDRQMDRKQEYVADEVHLNQKAAEIVIRKIQNEKRKCTHSKDLHDRK